MENWQLLVASCQFAMPLAGLEPTTSALGVPRSVHLSYRGKPYQYSIGARRAQTDQSTEYRTQSTDRFVGAKHFSQIRKMLRPYRMRSSRHVICKLCVIMLE
jgi:hypothetical protein